MIKKIPFSKLNIKKNDIKIVNKILSSGWLAHGKYNDEFENYICKYTSAKYACTVSSCTAGLHLSLLTIDIGIGDEVIVPSMTHTATAHAVEYTGAKVKFCDTDPLTGNITLSEIKKSLTKKTKAIIVVHMAGWPAKMNEISIFCKINNIKIIEDCAHALGSSINKKHVGLFGVSGVFSFYPTKQITTGEGGIVISNNKNFISKLKKFKAFGIDTSPQLRVKPGFYDVNFLGYNYRMTEFQAALGLTQIKRYQSNLKKRQDNAKYFTKLLSNNKNIYALEFNKDCSYFIFQIFLKNSQMREKVVKILQQNKIGFSIHYATPVPFFTYYKKKYNHSYKEFPNSVSYSKKSLSLPIHNNISKQDLIYIAKKLEDL